MLKRTKGRLLLTLLVVTGFAGTVNNTAPTKAERRFAIDFLKNSKVELQKELKGLSQEQVNFRPSPETWSVKECFYHIVLAESESWNLLEKAMKEPAHPELRSQLQFSDEELLHKIAGRTDKMTAPGHLQPQNGKWKSLTEAQAAFKTARMQYLKYIKTTTEDLRNHFITLPFGTVDCYQFILFISAHSERHHEQIREIISHPAFPKNKS